MEITYSKPVVTVSERSISSDQYDARLSLARHILGHFRATLTNEWGCDGVGYDIEKKNGFVLVNRSSVGPRNYAKGLETMLACERCQRERDL